MHSALLSVTGIRLQPFGALLHAEIHLPLAFGHPLFGTSFARRLPFGILSGRRNLTAQISTKRAEEFGAQGLRTGESGRDTPLRRADRSPIDEVPHPMRSTRREKESDVLLLSILTAWISW